MFLTDNPPIIYIPKSIQEALVLYKKNPNSKIFSGGTWIIGHQVQKQLRLGKEIINISKIDELSKIRRSERYIDFGSAVTLSDILNLRARLLPPLLTQSIKSIATPQVRNLATIGGNIAVKSQRMSLFPALMVLDARIELKKMGGSRWVELRKLINDFNQPDIMEDEIITRIRIPIEDWDFQQYRTIGERMPLNQSYMIGVFLCKISKSIVVELRSLFSDGHTTLFRPFQTEGNIIGSRLPLNEKEQCELIEIFTKELATYSEDNPINKTHFIPLFHWMLTTLSDHS